MSGGRWYRRRWKLIARLAVVDPNSRSERRYQRMEVTVGANWFFQWPPQQVVGSTCPGWKTTIIAGKAMQQDKRLRLQWEVSL